MRHHVALLLFAMLLTLAGCSRKESGASRPVVTVSIEPQRWLLDRLAGDRLEIRSLMDKNADPENFDPTLSTLRDVERSLAYFTLGNNAFEESTVSRLRENGTDLRIVDSAEGIELIRGTHSHPGHDHHGDGSPDPHIWLSVGNMRRMAVNMERALAELDPEGEAVYRGRLDSLLLSLDSLDAEINAAMAEARGESFVVWHPSLSYFARDYGLRQIALGTEGKEATPARLGGSIDEARRSGAKVMVVQPDDDPARSLAMARQAGVDTVRVNTLDYDWPATMRGVVRAFTRSRSARNDSASGTRGASRQQ